MFMDHVPSLLIWGGNATEKGGFKTRFVPAAGFDAEKSHL
jgi:hypothetical protein